MGTACPLPDIPFWILAPTGRVRIDWKQSHIGADGEENSYTVRNIPAKEQPGALDFSLVEGGYTSVICSLRVVEFFRDRRWKGIRFRPIDIDLSNMWDVDPLAKKWPPQWYPEGWEPHPNNLST